MSVAVDLSGKSARADVLKRSLLGLGLALPLAFMLFLVWRYSLLLPFLDDWHIVVDLGRLRDGQFGLMEYLWQQHNEHRMSLWKAVSLLSIALSPAYYYKVTTFIGFALAVVSLLLTLRLLRLVQPGNAVLMICASLLMFSPIYVALWNHPAEIIPFRSLLLSLALMGWALTRWPGAWPGTLWAAFACLLGTLSAGSGLAFWGVAAVCLAVYRLSGVGRNVWSQMAFLVLAGLLTGWVYFYNYQTPVGAVDTDPLTLILSRKTYFIQVILALLGKPLVAVHGTKPAAVAGLAGLLILVPSVFLLIRRNPARLIPLTPLLVLAMFSILNAIIVVYFRSNEDLEWLVGSGRYFVTSYFFWLAVFVFALCAIDVAANARKPVAQVGKNFLMWAAAMVCIAAYLFAWQNSTQFLKDMKAREETLMHYMDRFEQVSERMIPEQDWWISKEFLRALRQQRLSVFADTFPRETKASSEKSAGTSIRSRQLKENIKKRHLQGRKPMVGDDESSAGEAQLSPYQAAIRDLMRKQNESDDNKQGDEGQPQENEDGD